MKRPAFHDENCVSCGICAQVCPVSAIDMTREGKSGKYRKHFPALSAETCIGCGLCARSCPMEVIGMEGTDNAR